MLELSAAELPLLNTFGYSLVASTAEALTLPSRIRFASSRCWVRSSYESFFASVLL